MPARSYGDKLGYPAGFAAGFDPNHPAVFGFPYVSAVARGSDGFHAAFINMLNGRMSTRSGGQVGDGFDGTIGPYHITGSFNQTVFINSYPASMIFYTGTMAAIMHIGTSASFANSVHLVNINAGQWLIVDQTTGLFRLEFPASVFPYGANAFNIEYDTPYFLFTSWNGPTSPTVDFVARNLKTGQIYTAFGVAGVNAPHVSSATGEFSLGCDGSGAGNSATRIAAAMVQGGYCPGEVGLQWAEDPWSFWYPRRIKARKQKGSDIVVQVLRPDTDDSISGWTDQTGGTTTIFNSIDEMSANDADYIQSPIPPSGSAQFRLSNPTAGRTLGDPVVVSYRVQKTGPANQAINVGLYQGTSLIAMWGHVGLASLTGGGANITLSSDRLTATKTVSSAGYSHVYSNFNGIKNAKVYVEARQVVAGDAGVGITNSLYGGPESGAVYLGYDTNAVAIYGDGHIWYNAADTGSPVTLLSANDWIGIAIDGVAKTISFRNVTTAGSWSTPLSIPAIFNDGTPYAGVIWVGFSIGTLGTSLEVNFDGAFVGAPPSGYVRWDEADRLTESFQTFSQTLTAAQLASITNFNNLYIKFSASTP